MKLVDKAETLTLKEFKKQELEFCEKEIRMHTQNIETLRRYIERVKLAESIEEIDIDSGEF